MAMEIIINSPSVYRIILEEYPEGVYILYYRDSTSPDDSPDRDNLQDNWEIAFDAVEEDFGIQRSQWIERPDTRFNG